MKGRYIISRDRESMFSPAYWNLLTRTSLRTKEIYGDRLTKSWVAFFPPHWQKSIFLKEDMDRLGNYVAKRFIDEEGYFENIEKIFSSAKEKTSVFIKNFRKFDLKNKKLEELIGLAQEIKEKWLEIDDITVPGWFIASEKMNDFLRKSFDLTEEDFRILASPTEKSLASRMEYDLFESAKEIADKKTDLGEAAEKLCERYGCLPFAYDGPEYWNQAYFEDKLRTIGLPQAESSLEKLKKEKEARQQELEKVSLKLDKKGLDLFKMARRLVLWADERKEFDYKLHYLFYLILKKISEQYDIPIENLKYLFLEEIGELPEKKEELLKRSKERINSLFIVEAQDGGLRILSNTEKEKLWNETKDDEKEEIKGIVASRGPQNLYSGKVKVIAAVKDLDKIKEGEFLVAPMTSPNYILAMQKAAGFITDEGGVTCHAAIIAREMKKPCIIGTGNATKVLKDGDLAEMDVEKGVVKILKKA